MSISPTSPSQITQLPAVRTTYSIGDIDLDIRDFATSVSVDEHGGLHAIPPRSSLAADVVVNELANDVYQFDTMGFTPGDVVLDLGAHVGIVSLYLAKKYPFIDVYAYEPSPENYRHLLMNVASNKGQNVHTFNRAVTADGRTLNMIAYYECNSGGATGQLREMKLPHRVNFEAQSTTLDSIFRERGVDSCKLLKIDIEGSEHEVLMNAQCLGKVEFLAGEFHENDHLLNKGYSIGRVYEHITRFIAPDRVRYVPCRMAE